MLLWLLLLQLPLEKLLLPHPHFKQLKIFTQRHTRLLQLLSIDHCDLHYPEQTELPKSLSNCAKQNANNANPTITTSMINDNLNQDRIMPIF